LGWEHSEKSYKMVAQDPARLSEQLLAWANKFT